MVNGTRSSRPARGVPLSLLHACGRCVGRHGGAEPGPTSLSRPRRLPRGVRRGSVGSSDAAGTPCFRLLWLTPRGRPPSATVRVLSRWPVALPSRALRERWLCLGLCGAPGALRVVRQVPEAERWCVAPTPSAPSSGRRRGVRAWVLRELCWVRGSRLLSEMCPSHVGGRAPPGPASARPVLPSGG